MSPPYFSHTLSLSYQDVSCFPLCPSPHCSQPPQAACLVDSDQHWAISTIRWGSGLSMSPVPESVWSPDIIRPWWMFAWTPGSARGREQVMKSKEEIVSYGSFHIVWYFSSFFMGRTFLKCLGLHTVTNVNVRERDMLISHADKVNCFEMFSPNLSWLFEVHACVSSHCNLDTHISFYHSIIVLFIVHSFISISVILFLYCYIIILSLYSIVFYSLYLFIRAFRITWVFDKNNSWLFFSRQVTWKIPEVVHSTKENPWNARLFSKVAWYINPVPPLPIHRVYSLRRAPSVRGAPSQLRTKKTFVL